MLTNFQNVQLGRHPAHIAADDDEGPDEACPNFALCTAGTPDILMALVRRRKRRALKSLILMAFTAPERHPKLRMTTRGRSEAPTREELDESGQGNHDSK